MILPARFSDGISLSLRLKLLTGLWVGLAALSVVLTLLLSLRLENAASVIEEAGNLRMQAYRLAYMAGEGSPRSQIDNQVAEFEKSLKRISQSDAIHPLIPSDTPLAYDLIQSMLIIDWQAHILPPLQSYRRPTQVDLYRFAGNIELFLQALENANEKNTWWLRRFQWAIMLMTLVSSVLMLFWHQIWVIRPLQALREGAERIGQRHFDIPVPEDGTPEFKQVGRCFNQMGGKLKALYDNLEGQVAEQTHNLEKQNRNLTLLYRTTRDLHQSYTPRQAAEEFLNHILPAVGAQSGSICLENGSDTDISVHTAEHGKKPHHLEKYHDETFPIEYQNEKLGMLSLSFSDGISLTGDDRTLLQTLIRQLGVSLAGAKQEEEKRLLAVLQERNLIAQGLHDSIAQALTFLNLQVQMLETAFAENKREEAAENIGFIKTGVQECYEDVRELLLNFRTKISNKEFPEAVADLFSRFTQQTGTTVETAWENGTYLPTQDEQLQMIFILQESLSNIRKHARATHVKFRLIKQDERFTMTIQDNGQGFDTENIGEPSGSHVGLHIMQERAKRIRAVLEIRSQAQQGTTVSLTGAPKESLP
ncbi:MULTISPECIES: histidine kinase [Neisseria]|uniref:histidine kinase n=1 Tax=Neisseria TaxID=482 RepID=UPI000E59BE41|nr:type IV pili methyl-accepting chemotaxis transducer N-terminal domain-containing protein [Neisseria sp. Marseille-Q1983]